MVHDTPLAETMPTIEEGTIAHAIDRHGSLKKV